MAERHGRVIWPGIVSPVSCEYTLGQGITPGAAVLTCHPQPGIPYAEEGDLIITDGVETVVLPDCKVDRASERRDGSGAVWQITILDRRWRWRDCGEVDMWGNQLDPNAKFIPWSVISPVELARYCLTRMGEPRYQIDLPVGLTTADAAGLKEFLPTGINFPLTGVNPPIDWKTARPMGVLEQLAEMFGRTVVWRWGKDEVWVAERGAGGPLPPGSISSRCPGVTAPQRPDGIVVVGSPTRFQGEFELQAVGEEWDGKLVPIKDLSYAPKIDGAKHTVEVTGSDTISTYFFYYCEITFDGDDGEPKTFQFVQDGSAPASFTVLVSLMVDDVNNNAAVKKVLTATLVPPAAGVPAKMTLTAKEEGPQFEARVWTAYRLGVPPVPGPHPPRWTSTVKLIGKKGGASWARSFPPQFYGVRATDRLTLGQALDKARKSVWKYYQLSGRNVDKKGKILVPGYGRVERYQVILGDEQCEQIVPEKPDFAIRDRGGNPLVQNYYNGYSRAKPAAVFGAVSKRNTSMRYVLDKAKGLNTGPDEQVQVSFSVDNVFQMIRFSDYVYKWATGNGILEPDLRLKTAVSVRDAETNQPAVYRHLLPLPAATGQQYVYERHDDVQLNVVGIYRGTKLVGTTVLEADPLFRAGYYAAGAALRYLAKASLVNRYNGIVAAELDGAISQITWIVGDGGAMTTISLNHEHNTAVPPYPARRRAELLRSAVAPGGFLGQIGNREPHRIVPFQKPGG